MVERFNPAPLDKHPEDPKEAAKADREMDGNLWPVWLAHFRRQTRSAPHSQGREPARQIHCGFADGAEPRSRSYAPEEPGRTDRCVIRTMRGEGAGHPGLNCCASYWPISFLKAEVFSRSKSRSPVAA